MKRLFLSLCLWASCNTPSGTLREPDEYVGCATDENWVTFDDEEATAIVDDTQAPKVLTPTDSMVTQKPIVTWQRTATETGDPTGDVVHPNLDNPDLGDPDCIQCCPGWNKGALTAFHLPPISGDVFDLQINIDGNGVSHRVLTSLQEWTPPDDVWSTWAGHKVTVRIWRLALLHNEAKEGPFITTTPLAFSVSK